MFRRRQIMKVFDSVVLSFAWTCTYLKKKKPYFQISDHLGGGMDDAHLVEDGGPVIRDSDVPVRRLDHFVHSARSQRRPHCVRNGLRRHDVAENSWFRNYLEEIFY